MGCRENLVKSLGCRAPKSLPTTALKSSFLYGLPMAKLLIISRGQKLRPRFSRICLYSVGEHGKDSNIAIFAWTSSGKVVGYQ